MLNIETVFMMEELVSIIVPVFNSVATLERCINTVLNQSYFPIEVLLIDDGSSDGSENICRDYARDNDCVKVIHQKNRGVSSARNVGLKYATGKFITFVDADDVLHSDFVTIMVSALKRSGAGIAVCKHEATCNPECICNSLIDKISVIKRTRNETLSAIYYGREEIQYCWAKLWDRSVIGLIEFKEIKFCEDSLFTISVLSKYEGDIVFIKGKPLYGYSQHSQSVTKHLSASHLLDSITVISEVLNIARTSTKKLRNAAACFAVNNAFFAMFHAENNKSGDIVKTKASEVIIKNRYTVLTDIKAPLKTKCAIILSAISANTTNTIYQLYWSRFK